MKKNRKNPPKRVRNKRLTLRKRKFVEFYVDTGNATQSYINAGYSKNGAGNCAYRLLQNDQIKFAIAERRAEIAERADITAQDVIGELKKIAFANSEDYFDWDETVIETNKGEKRISRILIKEPALIDRDKKAAIAGIKETAQGGLEFKFHDKIKALEDLGKYFGIFNDADVEKARRVKKAEEPTERHDPTENLDEETIDKLIEDIEKEENG